MYQWQWDPVRREYYYYSPEENACIYQSGARIALAGTNQSVVATETQQYELFRGTFVELRAEFGTY